MAFSSSNLRGWIVRKIHSLSLLLIEHVTRLDRIRKGGVEMDSAGRCGRRCPRLRFLESEASRQLNFAGRPMIPGNPAEGAKVSLAVAGVFEVRSVGYVEGVAMQLQSLAFHNLEVLLQAEVVNPVAGAEDLVPAERSHAREHAVSRSIRSLDGGNST